MSSLALRRNRPAVKIFEAKKLERGVRSRYRAARQGESMGTGLRNRDRFY
jgi:hypothetical protein